MKANLTEVRIYIKIHKRINDISLNLPEGRLLTIDGNLPLPKGVSPMLDAIHRKFIGMTKAESKNEGFMPKLEIALIILFIMGFLAWAVAKCSGDKKQELLPEPPVAQTTALDTAQSPAIDTPAAASLPSIISRRVPILFVTIDGLKLRTQPNLRSEVIAELPLFAEVEFLNEVTSFQDTFNLGRQEAISHWTLIQNSKGKKGWVFGAGVDYYKHKHPGAY